MFTTCQESDKYSTVETAVYLNVQLKHATVVWYALASWLADLLVSMLTSLNHYRANKHDWCCAIRSHQVIIDPLSPFQTLRSLRCGFCDVTNMVFKFLDSASRNRILQNFSVWTHFALKWLSVGYRSVRFGTRVYWCIYCTALWLLFPSPLRQTLVCVHRAVGPRRGSDSPGRLTGSPLHLSAASSQTPQLSP